MELQELRAFVAVASERSFSRAARKLGRTQPAISQAIRRLETALGEPLIDRSSRDGTLTQAGLTFREYAQRVLDLAAEAERAVAELRDVQRGRVLLGANEAAIHTLLPLVAAFQRDHPRVQVDVRRVAARQMSHEVLGRALDFGVLTFHPRERGLASLVIGSDELVLLTHPSHALAARRRVGLEEVGRETVIAHTDPSPARERVLRAYEQRQATLNIAIALPSLDAIKRAVEMKMGVALLPRRCALSEIALGQLAAVRVPELRIPRHVRLVYRQTGERSHAAAAFLEVARSFHAAL
ncbi:MAG TPA: LysR family transcriptional regulator [Vicinamibacterales bacterium]|nr:LysR family transcriptional regulator [Vicinamibacterales bacterium]